MKQDGHTLFFVGKQSKLDNQFDFLICSHITVSHENKEKGEGKNIEVCLISLSAALFYVNWYH